MGVINVIAKEMAEEAKHKAIVSRNRLKRDVETEDRKKYLDSISFQLEHKESAGDILAQTGYFILIAVGAVIASYAMCYAKPVLGYLMFGDPIKHTKLPMYFSIVMMAMTVIAWLGGILISFTKMPRVEYGCFICGKKQYHYSEITRVRECKMNKIKVYNYKGRICKMDMRSKNMNYFLNWCKECGIPIEWNDGAQADTEKIATIIGLVIGVLTIILTLVYQLIIKS